MGTCPNPAPPLLPSQTHHLRYTLRGISPIAMLNLKEIHHPPSKGTERKANPGIRGRVMLSNNTLERSFTALAQEPDIGVSRTHVARDGLISHSLTRGRTSKMGTIVSVKLDRNHTSRAAPHASSAKRTDRSPISSRRLANTRTWMEGTALSHRARVAMQVLEPQTRR